MQTTEKEVFGSAFDAFKMCEACNEGYFKYIEENHITGFTLQSLIEDQTELEFSEALSLMRVGALVVRKAYKDNEFPKIIGITKRDPEKQEKETIATFAVEGRTPIQTVSLSVKEILATDYIVVYAPEGI